MVVFNNSEEGFERGKISEDEKDTTPAADIPTEGVEFGLAVEKKKKRVSKSYVV